MKVAIVHDFLIQMGGAEKVVEALHGIFPDAPIYTSACDYDALPAYYRTWDVRTSYLQRLPFKRLTHRTALMLYPMAFESFDLSGYDLVISSSSAFAKGVLTQPDTVHICYTHAPMRYAWSSRTYMENERATRLLRFLLLPCFHYLRLWDTLAASRVDHYIANSSVVKRRIAKFYRRESDVVPPPVETDRFAIAPDVGDYHIAVSRLVPYKRLELAVEAFTELGRPLKIVGEGRQRRALQAKAGPNIEFLGRLDDVELPRLLARAKAFIMPGEEDFGIAPVEANACGRPVIAYAAGGALDTQIDGVTGVLFRDQSVEALCEAVLRADDIAFDPVAIRDHALRFGPQAFREGILRIVERETIAKRAALVSAALVEELARR